MLTKPHTFVTSTTAQAAEVNTNFDTIYDAVGDQEFTEQNYITNDESVSDSLDALDQALKDVADTVSGVVTSQTFSEVTTLPATITNQMKMFVGEGNSRAETWPSIARENAGGEARILLGDANSKMWLYRNDAAPGMVIDTSVTDCVLSIKGGTNAYNANGGTLQGTWTQTGHTHSFSGSASFGGGAAYVAYQATGTEYGVTSLSASVSGTTWSGAAPSTYRPYAAVGTIQYPDMVL